MYVCLLTTRKSVKVRYMIVQNENLKERENSLIHNINGFRF